MTDLKSLQQEAREKAATIIAPLIRQIFHGDNSTSDKIHEELDNALDAFAADFYSEAYQAGKDAGRTETIEELFTVEKEKWADAVHCTCLGYALIQLSGGEDSIEGQEMEKRLLESARNTP